MIILIVANNPITGEMLEKRGVKLMFFFAPHLRHLYV